MLCKKAIEEEIDYVERTDSQHAPGEDLVKGSVTTDGGWQQKGSGRSYNSQSGHVTVLGSKSKKCLSYSVAKNSCRTCRIAKLHKKQPVSHECSMNWNGSSKAMEPFLTVKCLQEIKQNWLDVGEVTMDDDSTTLARIRRNVFPDVKKKSDINHVQRIFTSSLYKLKDEKVKTLGQGTIKYLKTCFSKAVKQNQGNSNGIKTILSAVIPHALGDHSNCPDTWCKRPSEDSHGITEDNRQPLEDFMKKYSTAEMQEKLSSLGSTNANESMNRLIARKAPKDVSFAESGSLDTRIEATVVQKNEGYKGITMVNVEHGLSPGKCTVVRCKAMDAKRKKKSKQAKTYEFKRRRYQLKEERTHGDKIRQVEEGTTYATGVSHVHDAEDTDEIPQPPPVPIPAQTTFTRADLVVFDLETTGLSNNDDIIQMSAKHIESESTFSAYVRPLGGVIPQVVANLTGLEFHGGVMYHNSIMVKAFTLQRALRAFAQWLMDRNIACPVLTAHNASFDARMLLNAFRKAGEKVPNCLTRFTDSYQLMKKKYPYRKGRGMITLSTLVQEFLPDMTYRFHDADEDTQSLVDLLDRCGTDGLEGCMISTEEVNYKIVTNTNKQKHINTYSQAVLRKTMSKVICEILAKSGLGLHHLKTVFGRSCLYGIGLLMRDRCGNSKFSLNDIVSELVEPI